VHYMKKLILSFLLLSFAAISFSQSISEAVDTNKVVIIKMENGDEFQGQIIQQDSLSLVLKMKNGELNLIAANITSIETSDYNGKFLFKNPNDTRYFFGPTAIPIKKGKGYYQNIVAINAVNYGITENFSIGGGFEFISIIFGNSPFWYLTPKAGFKLKEKVHLGGGLLVIGVPDSDNINLGYGIFTYGSSESNFSAGLGYGLVGLEAMDYPTLFFAGTHRVNNSIMLMTENYVIPNDFLYNTFYLGIYGIRILGKKNSFDVGLFTTTEILGDISALPYVSYVRVF